MAVPFAEIEREIVRQAGVAKGTAGAKVVGMAGAKVAGGTLAGGGGIGQDVARDVLVGKVAGSGGVQALATSGTIWSGKGLSLGLGLGLGAWGPVLVIAAGAAAAYAYLEYRRRQLGTDEDIEQGEQDEGFYPAQG